MLNKNLTGWLSIVCCGLLLSFSVRAADIKVSVDRNPIHLNESFQIIFSASESPDGSPDFAALQDNFQILNQQRSSNVSLINGKMSRNEQWVVSVMPKQSGQLLIPPVAFGSDSSQPLKVMVNDANQTMTESNHEDVFLDVQATPEKPFVQSQVLYTLKLFRRVQIAQASLNEPEVKDAVVEKLGEDSTYSTQINGEDYWVTERRYAIFPQQSGNVTIAPLTLTAEVVSDQRPRFNGFFNRQTTETRRVSSKALTLNVQPAPKNFADAWLSAESLEIEQSWSDNRLQSKVGEPLTRTITLTAKGATVGQLPELTTQTVIDGIKTYPDQPVLKEDKHSDGLVATREEKIAYIASKAGEYILPGLNISWFNTKTQKTETARLPEIKITALDAMGSSQPAPAPIAPQTVSPAESLNSFESDPVSTPLFWQGLSGFLALGWLVNVVWIYRSRRQAAVADQYSRHEQTPAGQQGIKVQNDLKIACLQNNPKAAKQALLAWGKQQFAVDNLDLIARSCAGPLQDEIRLLNQCLYAATQNSWNGQALWQAFSQFKTAKTQTKQKDEKLEPLYRL